MNKIIYKLILILATSFIFASCDKIELLTNKELWIFDIEAGNPQDIKSQIDYTKIEEYVDNTPSDKKEKLKDLAEYLSDGCDNDAEIAYSAYCWIAKNIEYDVDKLDQTVRMSLIHGQLARAVLRKEEGVCEGYANLFTKLTKKMGIENSVRINGTGINERHAWNGFKINEKWYLCDPTWAAGYLNENTEFVFDYEPWWFAVHPDTMITTHLPWLKKWQLIDNPLSDDDWEDQDEMIFPPVDKNSSNFIKRYLINGFINDEKKL